MALATERQAASGPVVSLPDRFNIADYLVDRHVREGRGGRIAILCGDESVTYGQVADRSSRLATGLRRLGLRREDRVMLLLHDTPAFGSTPRGLRVFQRVRCIFTTTSSTPSPAMRRGSWG